MVSSDERAAHRLESSRRAAVKLQLRRSAVPHHFDVAPQHFLRVAGAKRLHRRFLCREAAGEMDGRLDAGACSTRSRRR